ncbi:JAB domain-containing protein [Sphingomonas sp. Leaf339]|uniref:JAB domain-containing protein n=1 Tax=Sphingomonas sp. Leaf339 TaxID=1736343 RepID=UPI00138F342D|nr:JAB domain-containing protein [Sphingomonas sp. Leaf339]
MASIDATLAVVWADRLIAAFGNVGAVLAANAQRLKAVLGGEERVVALLVAQRQTMLWVLRERAVRRPIVATRHDLLRYLHHRMAYDGEESLRVLFLNGRRELLAEEVLAHGGSDAVAIEPRRVIVRALELAATGIVLIHNHPSGDPSPSFADRRFTRRLALAGECLGIQLHDHLIVARDGYERIGTVAPPVI